MFVLYETVQARLDQFLNDKRPLSNVVDEDQVQAYALAAVRKYMAHGRLIVHIEQEMAYRDALARDPATPALIPMPINPDLRISMGEWGWIEPLWMLYVEREQAIQLEASQMMGAGMFGRSSSEVAQEITMREAELPQAAFMHFARVI